MARTGERGRRRAGDEEPPFETQEQALDQERLSVKHLEVIQEPERQQLAAQVKRLNWLIDDFSGITDSVYQAAMIAAQRARRIGRRQKQEIDSWNDTHNILEQGVITEESPLQGIDNFHHPKPTMQALDELKHERLKFRYPKEPQ